MEFSQILALFTAKGNGIYVAVTNPKEGERREVIAIGWDATEVNRVKKRSLENPETASVYRINLGDLFSQLTQTPGVVDEIKFS